MLFVDDVLLFGGNSLDEWTCYRDIMGLFCSTTGMEISTNKFIIIALGGNITVGIRELFPYSVSTLEDG